MDTHIEVSPETTESEAQFLPHAKVTLLDQYLNFWANDRHNGAETEDQRQADYAVMRAYGLTAIAIRESANRTTEEVLNLDENTRYILSGAYAKAIDKAELYRTKTIAQRNYLHELKNRGGCAKQFFELFLGDLGEHGATSKHDATMLRVADNPIRYFAAEITRILKPAQVRINKSEPDLNYNDLATILEELWNLYEKDLQRDTMSRLRAVILEIYEEDKE